MVTIYYMERIEAFWQESTKKVKIVPLVRCAKINGYKHWTSEAGCTSDCILEIVQDSLINGEDAKTI
jgi:hypothetical protein